MSHKQQIVDGVPSIVVKFYNEGLIGNVSHILMR
jgi:hypothetical protein